MTKLSKTTGLITLAATLALASCKGEVNTDIVKDAVETETAGLSYELTGTPRERMAQSMKLAQESKGEGAPSMWKLSDDDTNIYLFGTVHLLPEGLDWRTDKFDAVISEMDTLYVEADIESPEALQKLQTAVMQAAVYTDGSTLSESLGDNLSKVGEAFKQFGVPEASIEPMMAQMNGVKPWAIGLELVNGQLASFGYNMESGVEKILLSEASAAGKPVKFMEEGAVQIAAISGGTNAEQTEALVFQLDTMDTAKKQLDLLVAEWIDGDENGIGVMMANPEASLSQGAYDRLLVNRNSNWIPVIEGILDDPGTKLVAVGAGHLAGPDSVVTMLESKGYKVEVVQ